MPMSMAGTAPAPIAALCVDLWFFLIAASSSVSRM
jgi:hypothetical protein